MTVFDKVIWCNECKKEFLYQSIQIKKTSVEIADKVLLLDYFTCPFCNTVYKILLVEEARYRELVDDIVLIQRRICQQKERGNLMLMQKLQNMALKKQKRIKNYVDSIGKKYPGSFVLLATENNQQREHVIYLPREDAE